MDAYRPCKIGGTPVSLTLLHTWQSLAVERGPRFRRNTLAASRKPSVMRPSIWTWFSRSMAATRLAASRSGESFSIEYSPTFNAALHTVNR